MGNLNGKRAAILVEDLYQELEVWYPLLRMREEGIIVNVLGTGKKNYKSKLGYDIIVDGEVLESEGPKYDAVIIPGGYAPDILRRYDRVNIFVKNAFDSGKIISSICHGLWVCASAGILKGKTATCFFAIKDDVINAGAKYVDQEVCVDGRLVTSRKPEDLPAFMKETLKLLNC